MVLPTPRGPLTSLLLGVLAGGPPPCSPGEARRLLAAGRRACEAVPAGEEGQPALADDDLQLALHVLYELHYLGYAEVDDAWEWDPDLLALRRSLEEVLEREVRAAVPVPETGLGDRPRAADVAAALFRMAADDDGPSLAAFVDRRATLPQVRELLACKSVYHLKEADPHTWAVPRLSGRAKAALVEIQADEYGGGRPERMHSALFARTMRAAGVDDACGAHVDAVPAEVLTAGNAMSLLGLHRRLRGAAVGHLTIFEMTSSLPNRRYGNGFRRLGFDADATWFFDEHVEADAVHEQVAGHDMAGALVEDEPALLPDVLLGAATALALDARVATRLLADWQAGRSALRPVPGPAAARARGSAA